VASSEAGALRVTALAVSAQLGGTERVLLDFAERAFEWDIAIRVVTPRDGPLIGILTERGIPAAVVPASDAMLRGSQRRGAWTTLPRALLGLRRWARDLARHPYVQDAQVLYSVGFKAHLATYAGRRAGGPAVVWHLHEFPPAVTGPIWRVLARRSPDALIANSDVVAQAWDRAAAAVVPNGVDLDRFRPRDRTFWIHDHLGIPREDRLFGMPAVLARWKGQLLVLEAFTAIAEQFPEVHLVLIGGNIYDTAAETSFERELKSAVARCHARGLTRVHLLPFQPKVELVYPELDATVHYSVRA
jgi:glycosyltransferase involved in cell wall biosynthesis